MQIVAEVCSFKEAKAAGKHASELIINLEFASREEARKIFEFAKEKRKKAVAKLPRIAGDGEINELIIFAKKERIKAISVSNIAELHAAQENGFYIYADLGMNIFNSRAIELLKENNVKRVLLSPELSLKEIEKLNKKLRDLKTKIELEALIHGEIEAMISRQCIIKSYLSKLACSDCRKRSFFIKDEKGFIFPVRADLKCINHIYNSKELCMLPYVKEILKAGINYMRINLCFKDERYIKNVLRAYANADEKSRAELEKMNKKLEKMSLLGFTKAHYFRGVP